MSPEKKGNLLAVVRGMATLKTAVIKRKSILEKFNTQETYISFINRPILNTLKQTKVVILPI